MGEDGGRVIGPTDDALQFARMRESTAEKVGGVFPFLPSSALAAS